MKKIHIIIVALIGIVSFTAAFGTGFVIKRNKAAAAAAVAAKAEAEALAAAAAKDQAPQANPEIELSPDLTESFSGTTLSENQLKTLICDLQAKMETVKSKQEELDKDNERISITRQTLAGEVEQLNQLRESLNQTLIALQEKERTVRATLTEIEAVEKTNLVKIAATYDKMDPTQSAKILTTMAGNNQIKDAVKILYYMSERNAGKLLGEIGTTRPETASALSLLLKQIKEKP
jgi:flagellar motility protein MotE (MotC chaperone)